MYELVTGGNADRFEAFVEGHPKGHFAQSRKWAAVKDNWKWEGVLSLDGDGEIRGALSLLFRKIPAAPFTIMYGPRGPVCDLHDRETISDLLEGARALAKKHHSYILKLDPDVPASDAEFVSLMKEFGFVLHSDGKNFEGIQPRFVFRLSVEGATEEEILARFESKTRYNLRLALRKGVETRFFPGSEPVPEGELEAFAALMETTGERDRFMVRGAGYFKKLLEALGAGARLYMAYYNGVPVAGSVAVRYGDKVWYLYGASANDYRNVMPNYLLQWEMIRWAIAEGARVYDFRGVSGDLTEDNPLYGLYRFKKGFSGDFCEFAGEFEYSYNKFLSFSLDKAQKAYKWVRYRVRMGAKRAKESGKTAETKEEEA